MATREKLNAAKNKSRVVARKKKSPKGKIVEDKMARGVAGREKYAKPGRLPR